MSRKMILAWLCAALLASCSTPVEPFAGAPAARTSAAIDGAALYRRQCAICHSTGGFGATMLARRLGADKAALDQRSDLDPAYVRVVVRKGLGDMPPFTRAELPDAELEAVAQYLTTRTVGGAQ